MYILYFFSLHLKNSRCFSSWPLYNLVKKNNTINFFDYSDNYNPNLNAKIESTVYYNSNNNNNNKNFYNHECILPITNNKNNGFIFSGNDETCIEKEEQNQKIHKIKQNFHKLNLLKILTNENVSHINKLKLIDEFYMIYHYPNKMVNNIYAGGLLNDWDWDLD
jgi:hypothetical protein